MKEKKIYQFSLLWHARYVSSLGNFHMQFQEQKLEDKKLDKKIHYYTLKTRLMMFSGAKIINKHT